MEQKTLKFSLDAFIEEFEETMAHFDDLNYFDVSETYSAVYHRFLDLDLSERPAIRGQLEGPVSFGFNVLDQDNRPILFDDTVRPLMFEFMAKRINVQLNRLKSLNPNAFMFIDEPGLQFIFSAMSGYGEQKAKTDLDEFFSMIASPKGIHLCGNPDWDFLAFKLETIWKALGNKGIDIDQIVQNSLLSPATCCLINQDKEKTVEKAFTRTNQLSATLRKRYHLS